MGARIAGTRIVGTSLVVLFWLSASGGRADDALVSRVGPIRQSVARRNDLRAAPSTRAEPLRDRTTLIVLPSRRGIGAALVHSF